MIYYLAAEEEEQHGTLLHSCMMMLWLLGEELNQAGSGPPNARCLTRNSQDATESLSGQSGEGPFHISVKYLIDKWFCFRGLS